MEQDKIHPTFEEDKGLEEQKIWTSMDNLTNI